MPINKLTNLEEFLTWGTNIVEGPLLQLVSDHNLHQNLVSHTCLSCNSSLFLFQHYFSATQTRVFPFLLKK